MQDVRREQAQEDTGMWRRSKTKSVKRLASLGLLQDAMGRVEQQRAAAEGQQILQQQVPSQQRPPREQQETRREQQETPRETSATGTGGAGW